ncbi:MAG: hypothetical protein KDH96_08810, partial [Candidatus Riesia sp.]|nr:hypothetical protein [Candidatus Riesia sp.]
SSSEVFIHQLTRMKLMSNHLTKCIQLLERTDPSILVHTEELDEDGEVDDNLPAHPYDYKKFVSDWEALISLWRNSWNKVDIEKMVKERNG